jgi:hypothetical protein
MAPANMSCRSAQEIEWEIELQFRDGTMGWIVLDELGRSGESAET